MVIDVHMKCQEPEKFNDKGNRKGYAEPPETRYELEESWFIRSYEGCEVVPDFGEESTSL